MSHFKLRRSFALTVVAASLFMSPPMLEAQVSPAEPGTAPVPSLGDATLAPPFVAAPRTADACEQARLLADAWFAENVAPDLPLTWEALAPFSVSERRLIHRRLDEDTRLRLWRHHLSNALADPAYDQPQRDFIAAVRDNFPRYMADPTLLRDANVEEEAVRLFGLPTAVHIFGQLGPRAESGETPERDDSALNAICHCNQGSMFGCRTPTGPEEECSDIDCQVMFFRCGFAFLFPCDGLCR